MRISDWSSDVCSSDLADLQANRRSGRTRRTRGDDREPRGCDDFGRPACCAGARCAGQGQLRTRAHALRSESDGPCRRSEEHTSELQSLMRISYAVFCLKKKTYTCHKKKSNKQNNHTKKDTAIQ